MTGFDWVTRRFPICLAVIFISLPALASPDPALPGAEAYVRAHEAEEQGDFKAAANAYRLSAEQRGPLAGYAWVRHALSVMRAGERSEGLKLLESTLPLIGDGPWTAMAAAETVEVSFNTLDPHDAGLYISAVERIDRRLWWMDPTRENLSKLLLTHPQTTAYGYELLNQLTTNGRYSWTRAKAAKELAASTNVAHRLAAAEGLVDQGQAREAGALLQGLGGAFSDDPEQMARWKYLNGRALIALRRGEEGRVILRSVSDDYPATEWARKAMQYEAELLFDSDRQQGIERVEEMLRRYPHSDESAELLWSIANELAAKRDKKGAVVYYLRLAEVCPQHALAGSALFEAARLKESSGAGAAAVEMYQQLLDSYPAHKYVGEAGYRCGRILELTKDVEAAKAAYSVGASGAVGDFYLHRCAERLYLLGERSKVGPSLRITPGESFVRPIPQPYERIGPPENRWENEPWMARLRFFGRRGYIEAEWEALHLIDKFDGAPRSGTLFQILADAGVAATAQDMMVATQWGLDGGRPTAERMQVLFPRPYWDDVLALASETGVDPYLMLAIARQESTFRPKIRSSAGAQGVMQLMPPTARFVARTESNVTTRDAANLHDPASSLRLGSYYLRQMIRRSDGNLVYALASYNAGPGNLDKWRRRNRTSDLERFVDGIPFNETRNYVKKVLGNYAAYYSLYGAGS